MKYAFINGKILDGSADMKPVEGKTILVDGEKIEKIVPAGSPVDGYEMVDLKGSCIMPGFVNLHVHLPASGKPEKKPSDPKKRSGF